MLNLFRLTVFGAGLFALAACESLPSAGAMGGAGENFAAGSALSRRLGGADRAALETAFLAAMETGETQSWRGGGAAGAVMPGEPMLANLLAHPHARLALARPDIDLNQALETEMGLYALTRNSNVRVGPDTTYAIAETLPSGAGVDVVGRVRDKSWMLVAVDGIVRGYVHQNLMIRAPGSELELAGGPFRKPVLCLSFYQTLEVAALRDDWTGAACHEGGAWRLAPPEPAPIEDDEELLEF
jgi:hypothetical protein